MPVRMMEILEAEGYRLDPAQARAAAILDALADTLAQRRGFFRRRAEARGVYLWGAVGGGKSLLMDAFVRAAPAAHKRRVHFHAFMAEVHARLARLRTATDKAFSALTDELAAEVRLLCLDELQIQDIADATIVGRLFTGLIARGTVVVATSNAPPERLYHGGLKRELFVPFIALIEARLDIVHLDAARDYRRGRRLSAPAWHVPADAAAHRALDAAFAELAGTGHGERDTLIVHNRELFIPVANNGVARFAFSELCDSPLGAADFGALARRYHTLIIDGIPKLDGRNDNIVRRFIILVDELYEHRVRLIASAEAPAEALLTHGRQVWDFRRTASRLAEMNSEDWLLQPHAT